MSSGSRGAYDTPGHVVNSAGLAGSHLRALRRELRMPVSTTLQAVLREPKAEQR